MSQPELRKSDDPPRWTAISIALLVIGLLIVIPATLCTIVVAAEEGNDSNILMLIVAFGGVPVAIGVALIYAALKIRPSPKSEPSAPGNTTPHWTGVSIALFVLGLVILLPSGLCAVLLSGAALVEGLGTADFGAVFMMLLGGGIPAAIGAALVYAALKLRRRA